MLVISRKPSQTVVIGGCIVVKVLSRKGNAIRLGIDASRDVPIVRGELCHAGTTVSPDKVFANCENSQADEQPDAV